jgi:hypothetical protein
MKNLKLFSFGLVLVLASISCSLFTPGNSNNSNNVSGLDFEAPAQPINVTVQLDQDYSTSDMISVDGGSLFLTGADGSEFTLDIPANALETDTLITLTAVESIEGAPLDDGPVAAVQLEPSGLFFNEILTLTIVPGQEIPIENQIIFGYEGDGQDYHLAVVDPYSREIKVKLMSFSGAGVGSGGDKEWAATLQSQANDTRARLTNKLGELMQIERQSDLLGLKGNDELWNIVISAMDQYVDQVLRKEIASSELDCKYAWSTMQHILGAERQNELIGIMVDSSGNRVPIMNDIWGKIERLSKIAAECAQPYSISGESNHVSFTGKICGLDKPFVIDATFQGGGSAKTTFTPNTVVEGTTTVTGGGADCVQTGEGKYTVSINEDGNGTIQWTTTDTLTCPNISNTRTGSFTLPLQLAPELSCP